MKSKCPHCHTILEINEKDYEPGVTVEKECPLCGEYVSFDIPEIKEPTPATPSLEDERIAQLERQLSLMKEQHKSAVEALEDKVKKQNDQMQLQQRQMLQSDLSPVKRTISIHGYTQWFAVNPDIKIYLNGQYIGKVGKGELFQTQIDSPCQLKFECTVRSAILNLDPSTDSDVYLSWDRITGSLLANKQPDTNFNNALDLSTNSKYVSSRSKTAAGILGIFLGGFGIHKFYLGKYGQGILYLLFCWTYIPSIVGFIEGIMYLTKSDQEFNDKYNTY